MSAALNKPVNGSAADVCSDYLCGFCPYDLLDNTSLSLGPCQKVHSEETRLIYRESVNMDPGVSVTQSHKRSLQSIIAKRDKKVEHAQARVTVQATDSWIDQVDELELEISKYILKRDNLSIDEANQNLTALKDLTKTQSSIIDRTRLGHSTTTTCPERQVTVCPVCACYIDLHLSEKRKAIHEEFPAHQAYLKIESRLAEIE